MQSEQDFRARYGAVVRRHQVLRARPRARLSFVVIAYRSSAEILDCLRAIDVQIGGRERFATVVLDCGGITPLRPAIDAWADEVVEIEPDLGLNLARNVALGWTHTELCAFVDDDGLLAPGCLRAILAHFDDPSVVALRGRIRAKHHPWLTTLGSHYDRGEDVRDDILATEGHMAVRRQACLRVGGFDERLYGHEGLDLTLRLRGVDGGRRVIYAPDVRMRHDYIRGWRHFVKKTRAYGGLMDEVIALKDDIPGYRAAVEAELARPTPTRRLGAGLRAVFLALKALAWAVRLWPAAGAAPNAELAARSPRRDDGPPRA